MDSRPPSFEQKKWLKPLPKQWRRVGRQKELRSKVSTCSLATAALLSWEAASEEAVWRSYIVWHNEIPGIFTHEPSVPFQVYLFSNVSQRRKGEVEYIVINIVTHQVLSEAEERS
jgi:hypothetical protein